jgi:hypothetical protein
VFAFRHTLQGSRAFERVNLICMERAAWTDERLDDLSEAMRNGFARVDQDLRDLRSETREGFTQVRSEMREGFAEVRGGINDIRTELRVVMYRVGGGVIVGLIGVIAAILARGV